MLIFKNNNVASVMIGDCLTSLATLPERSVNCCVTSPPYYGLRDYGVDGQIGLEDSPDAYVARLVEVFREVRRVLTDDGTLWLNIGDSYASNPASGGNRSSKMTGGEHKRTPTEHKYRRPDGLKPKDLIGIPWLLAFALRADGWYLRQDIIWHKPNPMPESVRDRCTKAHEYLFLLSKSERYFFDSDAMQEPSKGRTDMGRMNGIGRINEGGWCTEEPKEKLTRNRRSVWTVTPKPYKGAHFAVYPPELIEPCVLAGCPEGGTVLDPFGGSGTTGGVALKHGRNAVLCELSPDYVALMPARIESIAC
jgi:site-specific DNA-methyltransferase (adenine-specific)